MTGTVNTETKKFWRGTELLPEKMTTSMSHNPCHRRDYISISDLEIDFVNGSERTVRTISNPK